MTFTIEKGKHYSRPWTFGLYLGQKTVSYSIHFDGSCLYPISDTDPDSMAINKLCGFSFGLHHKNSIRIGWRPDNNSEIALFLYAYEDGIRSENHITNIRVSRTYNITIQNEFNKNIVSISIKQPLSSSPFTISSYRFNYPFLKIGYYLRFYFGGRRPAPHKMQADITKIKKPAI